MASSARLGQLTRKQLRAKKHGKQQLAPRQPRARCYAGPMTDLRYPIGRFEAPEVTGSEQLKEWIDDIARLPADLHDLLAQVAPQQLETCYRPGGWNVRQVVHHLADSHMNSYIRFKWALSEDRPLIKAYREELWAELPDYAKTPIEVSIELLRALHERWCVLLRALGPAELAREFVHPDSGPIQLATNIGLYSWHGRHHLAHIQSIGSS